MKMENVTLLSWDSTYILAEGEVTESEIRKLEPVAAELATLKGEETLETRAITLRYESDGENMAEDLMLIADNLVSALVDGIVKPIKVRNFSLKSA